MTRQTRTPQESDARVGRDTPRRQPRRRVPPPPPPPPTTFWSNGMKQKVNFGPPVQFVDDWQPTPPAPAPQPQQHGYIGYDPLAGRAQNGFAQQNIQPGNYTVPVPMGYQQTQGIQDNFAAPQQYVQQQLQDNLVFFRAPEQLYYDNFQALQGGFAAPQQQTYDQGQGTQMSFTAPMQPQDAGAYRDQGFYTAPTQPLQYPQIQGVQNTLIAQTQQSQQPQQQPQASLPPPDAQDISAPTAPVDNLSDDTFANVFGASSPTTATATTTATTATTTLDDFEWPGHTWDSVNMDWIHQPNCDCINNGTGIIDEDSLMDAFINYNGNERI